MQKDDLIQLHMLLLHVKKFCEGKTHHYNQDIFQDYHQLNVQPQQVFKSKKEHKTAISELCIGIEKLLNQEEREETKQIFFPTRQYL